MKMSLIIWEPASQVEHIWNEYHKDRPNNSSFVIPAETYKSIIAKARYSPIFIFPVRWEAGFFNLVSQNQGKSFIYTTLEEYQWNPTKANPYLITTCFDELVESKYIALVRNDIVAGLNKEEVDWLNWLTLSYYLEEPKFELVKAFNHAPQTFDFKHHIDTCLQIV